MEGYFVSPDFKVESVYEHLLAIQEDPKHYGLTTEKIRQMQAKGYTREAILIEVLKKGWVRVRGHQDHYSVEGWGRNDDVLAGALIFGKKTEMWDSATFLINNIKTGRQLEISYGELKKEYAYKENPRIRFLRRLRINDIMRRGTGRRWKL